MQVDAQGKTRVYLKGKKEHADVWPVDARELIASGAATLPKEEAKSRRKRVAAPKGGDPAPAAGEDASSVDNGDGTSTEVV